jgi:hypothetical protein
MSLRFLVWVTGPAIAVMACTQESAPETWPEGLVDGGMCPNLGPQDCNPDRNPGGAVCCLSCAVPAAGVRYRVTFIGADAVVVATATLSPTGCRAVNVESAAGSAALRVEDDYYWLALGQAFGTPELRMYPATCGR